VKKRSALITAAALVLALVVGGVGLATGIVGLRVSSASEVQLKPRKLKPKVKTIRRTIKVHRTLPAPDPIYLYESADSDDQGADDKKVESPKVDPAKKEKEKEKEHDKKHGGGRHDKDHGDDKDQEDDGGDESEKGTGTQPPEA
jgi:hypothetical protein